MAVPLARRNLFADSTRFMISVGGVTLAMVLILVVQSVYQGFSDRMGALPERLPADIWVSLQDAPGFTYKSTISDTQFESIRQVDGVETLIKLHGGRYRIQTEDASSDVYLLAFDAPDAAISVLGIGAPGPGEIIIDKVLAETLGLESGDEVETMGLTLTVSDVVDLAGAGVSSFAMISVQDAMGTIAQPGFASYLLATTNDDAAEVVATIEAQVPGVTALTKEDFAASGRSDVSDTFLPIIRVLLWISFAIGVAFVGVVTYIDTVQRERDYGVLKAIGATNRDLYRIVLSKSMTIGLLGFFLSVPLAFFVNRMASSVTPAFITSVRWQDVGLALVLSIGMSFFAAGVPIRRVANLDPATVFRA